MGKKRDNLYSVVLDGAKKGMVNDALNAHVLSEKPGVSSKQIVKASILVFSDSSLSDPSVLNAVSSLAVRHRLLDLNGKAVAPVAEEVCVATDVQDEQQPEKVVAAKKPVVRKTKPKAAQMREITVGM
jgi:hypothetical protein